MDKYILDKIYSTQEYLEYLRFNPSWYRKLHYNKNSFPGFENKVKEVYKMTMNDKIENVKKQIEFMNSLINYINNS